MKIIIKTFPNGKKYGYIIESYRIGRGKNSITKKRTIHKFGPMDELKKQHEDVNAYMEKVLREYESGKEIINLSINPNELIDLDKQNTFNVGCLYLKKMFRDIKLDVFLDNIKKKEAKKYKYKLSDIALTLICMQALDPGSKKHAFDRMEKLIIDSDFELYDVYRSLDVLSDFADEINDYTYKHLKKYLHYRTRIYYYDCTDFYFTSSSEDELRKCKKSKEGIYAPLVQMGILMDEKGLLVGMIVFPGSSNEQPSLKALEVNLKEKFNIDNVVICTDAGLASHDNRLFNSINGRSFICTHPLKHTKDFIKQYVFQDTIIDGAKNNRGSTWSVLYGRKDEKYTVASLKKAYEKCKDPLERKRLENIVLYKTRLVDYDIDVDIDNNGEKESTHFEQKLIVTFSLKYYLFQKRNLDVDLESAQMVINGEKNIKDAPDKSFKRLLKSIKSKKKDGEVINNKDIDTNYTLNKEAISEESKWFGYYAIATNLYNDPVEDIIAVNKQRWQIEYAFRNMKTIFKGRAIYLSTPKHIKGHFEIVYLTLNMFKALQMKIYDHFGYKNVTVGKLKDGDEHKEDITPYKIIESLRNMSITMISTKGKETYYVPSFKRTILTDAIGEIFDLSFAKSVIMQSKLEKYLI